MEQNYIDVEDMLLKASMFMFRVENYLVGIRRIVIQQAMPSPSI